MNDQPDAVLLASGGLDSTTLAYQLIADGLDFVPLFVDYGQHSARTEFDSLRRVLPPNMTGRIETVTVPDIYRGSDSRMIVEPDLWTERITDEQLFVPYRNLLLLTIGAAFAQVRKIPTVYAAFIDSNFATGVDCTTDFLVAARSVIARFGGVKVEMPFHLLPKAEVARRGVRLGAPVAETFSCLARAQVPCGACANCIDRRTALAALADADYSPSTSRT